MDPNAPRNRDESGASSASSRLPRDVELADGTRITLRAIAPEDAPLLKQGFEALSPLSRYRRFMREMPELNDATVAYLTNIDGTSHLALVAVAVSPDLKHEEIVGVARAIRASADAPVAEVAVVVADAMQRRGLGRLLLDAVRHVAKARGVQAFRAEVLAENEPVRLVLAQQGIEPVSQESGLLLYEIPLTDDPPAGGRESVFSRFLRVAASPVGMAIQSLRDRQGEES